MGLKCGQTFTNYAGSYEKSRCYEALFLCTTRQLSATCTGIAKTGVSEAAILKYIWQGGQAWQARHFSVLYFYLCNVNCDEKLLNIRNDQPIKMHFYLKRIQWKWHFCLTSVKRSIKFSHACHKTYIRQSQISTLMGSDIIYLPNLFSHHSFCICTSLNSNKKKY